MTTQTAIDEVKLMAFMDKVVGEFGAIASSGLVVIGDRLGLYRAMAGAGPLAPEELAERTRTAVRYVRLWLINQAAGGYVEYDPQSGRYRLPDEHALALADETSPVFVAGGFQLLTGMIKAEPRIVEAFRTDGGMLWHEHDPDLFEGTERFFRPGYAANLVQSWIPALEGVREKLEAGAIVADVGCGHGASTVIMAGAFPRSRFFGFDNHAASIEAARRAAATAGVAGRVTFEVVEASAIPGTGYDLITYFDCLHDMGDPKAAAERARETLAPDGAVLVVEPMAGEQIEKNLNPVGRIFSAGSTFICTPHGVASGGASLGTLATDGQIGDLLRAAGFSRFRRAIETPFNRVFEARA